MAARGRRGEARVRGGEPRGWLYAEGRGEQVEEGPRRQCPRHCLSAWSRGNDDGGGAQLQRERERGRAGLGWLLRAARRAVVGDWAGPVGLACLPPALAFLFFFFFLKTLFFFYFLF